MLIWSQFVHLIMLTTFFELQFQFLFTINVVLRFSKGIRFHLKDYIGIILRTPHDLFLHFEIPYIYIYIYHQLMLIV